MRIVYGVNGQGLGHAMRSKVVLDYLTSRGHEIKVVCFGKSFDYLKEFFDCFEVTHWELVYKNNKLSYLQTGLKDVKRVGKVFKSFRAVKKLFDEFNPNFVITDYEPMVSILAKAKRLPCLSIGNHHFITKTKISYPKKKYFRYFLPVKMVNDTWTPFADLFIVASFADVPVKNKKTVLVPPIVQTDVALLSPETGDQILVYLTAGADAVIEEIKKLDQKFIVYGYDKDEVVANLQFKKFSRQGFIHDLQYCKAVLATAGFTLISEALSLKKPYFCLPIAKQFEQILNGLYIKKCGFGDYADEFELKQFEEFLKNLPEYQKNLERYPRPENGKLFNEIEKFIERI
jgi:uncharacterized protein (TIGR00661 family)